MASVVHVVHCIDTEGPLHESLTATFERLKAAFGVDLPPSRDTLRKLQAGAIDLGGQEEAVARMLAPHQLAYNGSWEAVDTMLFDCMAEAFRFAEPDSFGGGWIYNWHCVDHVGYAVNPRRRDIGYHNVFDHYRYMMSETGSSQDGLHFHYHPMPFSRQSNHCATHYFANGDTLFQVLARRIIDRGWFPSTYRPGFHTIRPDSHWFLEQFIPFDYANQACSTDTDQPDLAGGRYGDWRRAPRTWQPYHPAHDDYQRPGDCRRWVARILNLGSRHRELCQGDVDQAFAEAAEGLPVILAFADHDFRDIRPDVNTMRRFLAEAARKYPQVRYKFSEAREAMRAALGLEVPQPLRLDVRLGEGSLTVAADRDTFGPQPFLAMKTLSGTYHHDNLDVQVPLRQWSYVFDEHTIPLWSLDKVGIAACDAAGNVTVAVVDPMGQVTTTVW